VIKLLSLFYLIRLSYTTDGYTRISYNHRYLREIDSARHIHLRNIHFNMSVSGGHKQSSQAGKAGRLERQASWKRQAGLQGRVEEGR
jgi:hypothetical protein